MTDLVFLCSLEYNDFFELIFLHVVSVQHYLHVGFLFRTFETYERYQDSQKYGHQGARAPFVVSETNIRKGNELLKWARIVGYLVKGSLELFATNYP